MNTRSMVMASLWLAACAGNPPADWQINAKDSLDDAVQAYLGGNSRLEARQFARGKSEVARTGQVPLAARVELLRCATRVASLDFGPCQGYQALAQDATPTEQAYARYLEGNTRPDDLTLLPTAAREITTSPTPEVTLASIADPFSRLVAAGTLLRRGLASDGIIGIAVDSAAAQGWRRPLLAWLTVQHKRALARNAHDEAARLQRRIDLVTGLIP
ncbi:MAG: hypothetical protein JNL84_09480 [Candidatus Accumulibacter sp.]|nr:hypothetical protein [Accumulibacter sp.]